MLIAQKKKFLISVIGVVVLVVGFWTIQAPKVEAAETIGKFVRIKIDGDGGTLDDKDLWNAFITDNGEFDDFGIPNTVDSYNSDDHVCGLLLTDEDGGVADKDYVVWTKKGAILGKNTDIKDDVDDVGYQSCCNNGWNACSVPDGTCDIAILNDADKVFQKNYGLAMEANVCNENVDAPCTGTRADCCKLLSDPAGLTYTLGKQILCGNDKKWHRCDDESACVSDGTSNYACNSNDWDKCSGTCTGGVCDAAVCDSNPTVTISPTSQNGSAGATLTYTVTVNNNDPASCSNTTFSLTKAGCPSGWTCNLGSASLNIAPQNNVATFLTLQSPGGATSGDNAVVTVTATGASSNTGTGTATYTVENCPANFAASFTKDCYTTAENIIINAKVGFHAGTDTWGCGALYEPSAYTNDRWDNTFQNTSQVMPGTWNNYNTSFKVGSYPKGVWRFTLNEGTTCKGNDGCMDTAEVYACCSDSDCAPQTCNPATHTCVAAAVCTVPACNGATQYCSGGSWVNCPGGQTCSAGVCSGISAPLCQSALIASDLGKLCGVSYVVTAGDVAAGSWCCSAANGVAINKPVCQAMDPACAVAPPPGCTSNGCGGGCPANCTGADDPDCAGACLDATCATDTDCVAPPPAASCSGPNMYTSPLMFGYCTIPEIIAAAINWILGLVSAIIILILIFGGITYVISAGDEERIKAAKNTILYAIIGLAIILLAYTMVNEVKDILKIVP